MDFADLTPIEGGWSGETFVAEVAGEKTVVRVFADPRHHPQAAEIQETLLRLVRGLVPVPRVLEVRRGDPAAGTPGLLITEFVDGVRGDLSLAAFGESDLGVVGERLGRIAGTLAGIPQLRPGIFTDAELRVEPFDVDLAEWVASYEERLDLSGPELDGLREVAGHAQDLLDGIGRCSLVHSDLNPKNVLLDGESLEIVALVDWEFAHAGCPVADLGNLVRFDRAPAYVGGVLSGFRTSNAPEGRRADLLDLARSADLVALVELASRRHANPVAERAWRHLRAIARSGDLHALPDE